MPASVVRTLEPRAAAEILKKALGDRPSPATVADASVASGLPRYDTESGLAFLTKEYRGHLRVSEDGDLVHVFPHGFSKPWETKELAERVALRIGHGLLGVGRFVIRAWLLVSMVAYAVLFLAILVGLTFAGRSSDRDSGGGAIGHVFAGLFRMIADALFWTFHPWSPLYIETFPMNPTHVRAPDAVRDVPFYEKVNRFVFGPDVRRPDPHEERARVLAEIRRLKGRIGLADVMRVTGLSRDRADPLMAELMLEHDGSVDVAEQGGIVYRFESLRRTAETTEPRSMKAPRPGAAWDRPPTLAPLIGNTGSANAAIVGLNLFNLFASAVVLANGLTVRNIFALFERRPRGVPLVFPDHGTPIAFGLVPLVFSLVVLALPAIRAGVRLFKEKAAARERARLAIMREVLTRAPHKEPVHDETLKSVFRVATGDEPTSKEITRYVVDLGGDVDVGPEGEVRYRFADLEAEAEALEEERATAPASEAKLGRIVFTSES